MPAEPPGSLAGAVAIRHSQVWPGTGGLQQVCPGARGRAIPGQAEEEVASNHCGQLPSTTVPIQLGPQVSHVQSSGAAQHVSPCALTVVS